MQHVPPAQPARWTGIERTRRAMPWSAGLALAGLWAATPVPAAGQDVLEQLRTLAEDNARAYIRPLAEGLGLGLTQGAVLGANTRPVLAFDIGLVATAAFVPDDDDLFTPVLPASVTVPGFGTFNDPYGAPGSAAPTPTVTGPEAPGVVLEPQGEYRDAILAADQDPTDFRLRFPRGFDFPVVPFLLIQGSVGLPLGTEIGVRVIPEVTVSDEVGGVSAAGFSVKHSLSQWAPNSPLDVAGVLSWQSLSVGDYLDADGLGVGVVAGRSFGPLHVFASGSIESADLDVRYAVDNPDDDPSLPPHGTAFAFTHELDAATRLGIGGTMDLVFLKLSLAYSLSEYNAITARAAVGFD